MTELKKGVYWVGFVDWDKRRFHGEELSTQRGTTYNSYLIVDEKIALVDTVWGPYQDRLIKNISEIVDPSRIDFVVANHGETDHSGGIGAVLQCCPNATVVVSKRGEDSIEGHYHQPWKFKTVKTGDRISLGRNELVFVEATMLHWPDSMFTYVSGANILMSNDAFGQHYATSSRFDDEVDQNELNQEALKYYANILTPFSAKVKKKIEEVMALNLPIDIIAPSHGVIWRKDPMQIVKKYTEWAAQVPEKSAVIVFDTMWQGTREMAEAIADGLTGEGVPAKLLLASATDRNDIMVEMFKAKAVILGSPTFNRGLLPTIMAVLENMRGLDFKNKIGAAFGAYGWGGESVKLLEEYLDRSGIPRVAEGVRAKWQPKEPDLEKCRALGRAIAAAVKA
ncbi:MAG: flavodoxin domain-containing protein [bacterium]